MKKSSILLAFAAIALSATSCFKDLGNYDYKEFETFEVKELKSSYSVISFQENLKIEPEIISKATDFEYRWFIAYKDGEGKQVVDTISREKVLDVPFEYKTGQYPLYFKVMSRESGAAKFIKTEVRCTTPFMDAFYILKKTADGNTEMDIHYPSGNPSYDMIAKSAGAALQGAPKSLSYMPGCSYLDPETANNVIDHLMIPASEKGRVTFRLTDMKIARSNEDWFYAPYPIEKIRYSMPMWAGIVLITDDGMHQNYQVPAWGMLTSGIFSNIPNRTEDQEGSFYKVSSDICYFNDSGMSNAFFYNEETNQFINIDFNSSAKHATLKNGELVEEIKGKVLDLVETSLDGGRMYILCEDEEGNRYYYYADGTGSVDIPILKKGSFKKLPEFNKADKYAGSRRGGNLLYALYQNEVYAFNPGSEKSEKLKFTDLPSGNIIYLDTMHFIVDDEDDISFNYLMVGVDNGGKYALAMYNVVGGVPVKDEGPVRILTGEGELHNVQYVNALKNPNTSGEWSVHF